MIKHGGMAGGLSLALVPHAPPVFRKRKSKTGTIVAIHRVNPMGRSIKARGKSHGIYCGRRTTLFDE